MSFTPVTAPRLSDATADPADPLKRSDYETGRLDGIWFAVCLRGGPNLEAATEGELEALIAADRGIR